MTVKLTWYGHACWKIEMGKHTLLIDPYFSGNPTAPITPDQVKPDYILVSHGHGDHLGDTVNIAKRTG
ncbi:MAG: MBL fold metallo-hydrolase, partial [Anaerolineales bacterium]|nr:MBL fold metallo-hydrolase [Anaerolineales bacterium]